MPETSSLCSCIGGNAASLLTKFEDDDFVSLADPKLTSDGLLPTLSADDKVLLTELRLPDEDDNEMRMLTTIVLTAENCRGN